MHARMTVTDWMSIDCEHQKAPYLAHSCAGSESQPVSAAQALTIINIIIIICAEFWYVWPHIGHSTCELCAVLRLHL